MAIQREEVIRKALDLLDEVGLEGLTMRRLADALEIKAASLYWHFTNKQALIDGMADALLDDVAQEPVAGTWQDQMRHTALELRRALLSRRDGARVFAGTTLATRNMMRVAEALTAPAYGAGASARLAGWGGFSLACFVYGFVIEEQGWLAQLASGVDLDTIRGAMQGVVAGGEFPAIEAAMEELTHIDADVRFVHGVDLWIAGIEAGLAPNRAAG
ncbi:TetR/AcrR family transcriptional regulator C-terminal domain-containing protein [Ideonella sp. DXS29W]|uniref:TetR/AcrR family transcriptional regulator C-terminal domain-containing protein n=1 Tax=Ideonella lacteola TaxID=2984193 RepID=A0ABU9BHE6_9BURK